MFSFNVGLRKVYVNQTDLLVSDSRNVYLCKFTFTKDWNGLTKTVVFRAGKEQQEVLLDATCECEIPWEVLLKHNVDLEVGVYGTQDEDVILNTTLKNIGKIQEGAKNVDNPPKEPTPDVYQQILSNIGNLEDLMTEDKSSLVAAINELDSKPIDGGASEEQGPQGPAGADGKDGADGVDGKSAYEIAVENGFDGDVNEWLKSLKGDAGKDGAKGQIGPQGEKGDTGEGVPAGGTTGQILAKESDNDFDTHWVDPPKTNSNADSIPVGVIVMWSGEQDNIPDGWALCNGENGTPDLRDKFVLGAGTRAVGETGGSEEVTLTEDQMPKHNHSVSARSVSATYGSGGTSGNLIQTVSNYTTSSAYTRSTSSYTGSSDPHPNMPPYYVLCYIMKI